MIDVLQVISRRVGLLITFPLKSLLNVGSRMKVLRGSLGQFHNCIWGNAAYWLKLPWWWRLMGFFCPPISHEIIYTLLNVNVCFCCQSAVYLGKYDGKVILVCKKWSLDWKFYKIYCYIVVHFVVLFLMFSFLQCRIVENIQTACHASPCVLNCS